MKKLNIVSLFSSAALALALVSPADATTVTFGGHLVTNEGYESSVAHASTTTFDNYQLPASFHTSGTPNQVVVLGDQPGQHSAPAYDCSAYLSTGSGTITDTLASGITSFGFYWGSVDAYNNFSITETNGHVSSTLSLSGAQLATKYGLSDSGANSYFVNFSADPGETFTSASFGSSANSFEFDNVATATPEPATVGMLAGGLLMTAGVLRRRKA